jgi:hypothetical protein
VKATEERLDEIRRAAAGQSLSAPAGKSLAASYHGLPLLKKPVWTWEVPLYFFAGGTAGAASVMAAVAQLAGGEEGLVRDARVLAAIGATVSAPLLISDLGRPERFLYMLRVFKPQSPMSVGAWTLAVFGGAATTAALFRRGVMGNAAGAVAAASGLVMCTYTGVLLGATTIPVWSHHKRLLPSHFGASAVASAASVLELRRHREPALNLLALGAAAWESFTGAVIESTRDTTSEPLRSGPTGTLTRIGGVLSGPLPLALRLLGGRSVRARRAAAVAQIAGSLITRFAWIAAPRFKGELQR